MIMRFIRIRLYWSWSYKMTYLKNDTLTDPVHQVTANTSDQSPSDTGSVMIVLNGSTIEYTANAQAVNVVYEIAFSARRINDQTFQTIVLQESTDGGSTWSDFGYRTLNSFGNSVSSSQAYRWYHHLRYVIPAYSGTKSFRLHIGSYSGPRKCIYHGLDSWDGSSTTSEFTQTSLIMYSIL